MPEDSVRRYLKYHLTKLKSFFFSKDVLSFLVFLLLSASFWLLNALNEEREMTLRLPVSYSQLPADIRLDDTLPAMMELKLKDEGINLWSYVLSRPKALEINLNQPFQEQGIITVSASQYHAAASRQLMPSTQIQVVFPENIVAQYHRLHSRKVPIRLDATVLPADQYMLNTSLKSIPDSLVVYGSKTSIARVQDVPTQHLKITNLKDTMESIIGLVTHDSLSYSLHNVKVISSAEMFTEKAVRLPVQIINHPDHLAVRSFPAEVSAVFNITISKFRHYAPGDIQVLIDFNDIIGLVDGKRRLKVIKNQPFITNIRIKPDEVEFLLEEK
jgi:hypothetical protein